MNANAFEKKLKQNKREIWSDWTHLESKDILSIPSLSPIDVAIVRPEQLPERRDDSRSKMKFACAIDSLEMLELVGDQIDIVLTSKKEDIQRLRAMNRLVGAVVDVEDAASMHAACALIPQVDYLILRFFTIETNIPLELLIAEAQEHKTYIVKYVQSIGEAMSARGVLESGPNGICFAPKTQVEMSEARHQLVGLRNTQLDLKEVEVLRSEHIGVGYRGCVDCTTLFDKDEGILVGSTSTGGILMAAEVHYLPFMDLRPFRVNAGAVHSYVWCPENRTHYISELTGGREVLAVNTQGRARPVQVGRTKIEIRSLRLIEATDGHSTINVIIQDDWHVRVMGADGSALNSTTITPGTKLLALMDRPGRHVGIQIDEFITEQ